MQVTDAQIEHAAKSLSLIFEAARNSNHAGEVALMKAAAAGEMYEALKEAVTIIKIWHGDMGWEIYNRASPEMKRINAVLAKADGRTE